jgi:hypothetical protein
MTPPTRTIWAYTYRLDPPQSVPRLKEVRAFLEREHTAALARAGTWEGRLVVDDRTVPMAITGEAPPAPAAPPALPAAIPPKD